MITELTKQQEEFIPIIRDKWINLIHSKWKIDQKKTTELINTFNSIMENKSIKIEYLDSPLALLNRSNEIKWTKGEIYEFGSYISIIDYVWIWYGEYCNILWIKYSEQEKFDYIKQILENYIYDMILLDDTLLICGLPDIISTDNEDQLHNVNWVAIWWKDWFWAHFLEWISIENDLFDKLKNNTLTVSEILKVPNTEKRRVLWKYSNKNWLNQIGKLLDKTIDEQWKIMKIWEIKIDGKPALFYNCICPSTDREYFLWTQEKKCWDAKYKSWGINPKDWKEIKALNEW